MIRVAQFAVLVVLLGTTSIVSVQSAPATPDQPFTVEYYYKAKWGYADEFLQLFKKNHYPVLKKQQEMGRIVKVWMDQPRYHATEDGRWDYRFTIVFKSTTVAIDPSAKAAVYCKYYLTHHPFKWK